MKRICYWCGSQAASVDHVPPRCFFPKQMRESLITVPACKKHNEELGKLDEKFRLFLQATSNSNAAIKEFENKTIRSLKRSEAKGFHKSIMDVCIPANLNGKSTLAFGVKPEEIKKFSEKILRGLYFNHFKEVFSGRIDCLCSHIHPPDIDIRPLIQEFASLRRHLNIGNTKNKEIFTYECGKAVENGITAFAMICTFYGDVTFFGVGTPN
jgi:hypothetical protein